MGPFSYPSRTRLALKVLVPPRESTVFYTYAPVHGSVSPFRGTPWQLPRGGRPAPWQHTAGRPVICRNGFHASSAASIGTWLVNPKARLFAVELAGRYDSGESKITASDIRLLFEIQLPWQGPRHTFSYTGSRRSQWFKWRGLGVNYGMRTAASGREIARFLGLDPYWERALELRDPIRTLERAKSQGHLWMS